MNPRSIGNFLKSKFGLFLVFVAVLFSGLWIYGRQQAEERAAERLAAQSARKVELGQVRVPLNQGLESGIPQPAGDPAPAQPEEWGAPGAIVPFRPVAAKPAAAPIHRARCVWPLCSRRMRRRSRVRRRSSPRRRRSSCRSARC
jgi:hypothetical protein